MVERTDGTKDRRRTLQGILQGEYPGWRISVESVTSGGFDGFLIWASRPDDGKRTIVHRLTRDELSSDDVGGLAEVIRGAIATALPAAP